MMGKPTVVLLALLSSTIILGAALTIPSVTNADLGCVILRSLGMTDSDSGDDENDEESGDNEKGEVDDERADLDRDEADEENDNNDRMDEEEEDDEAEDVEDVEDDCNNNDGDEKDGDDEDTELKIDSQEFRDVDLKIEIDPLVRIMSRNDTGYYEITISSFELINENTSLRLETILPAGTEISFTPEHGFSNFTSTLEIVTGESTPEGNYSLTVIASNSNITRSKDIRLIIQDFF